MDKKDCRYYLKLPYPENLIRTVCQDEEMEINEDRLLGLQKVMETLTDREQDALYFRFRERQSFQQIGDRWGFPTDRARKIYEMTLRKIRRTSRLALISLGYHGAEREREKAKEAARRNDAEAFQKAAEMAGKQELSSMSIQELELPARITNRLADKKICTVMDLWIISQRHPEEYSRINGLGEKSRGEIRDGLRSLGFDL